MRRHRAAVVAWWSIACAAGCAAAPARAIDFTEYFPVSPGARWIYRCTDSDGAHADTPVVVSCSDDRETLLLQDDPRCARDRSYLIVADTTQFGLAEAVNGDGRVALTPPARYLPRNASPGTSSTASGTLVFTQDGSAVPGTYDESITVDGFETVETPAGTFRDTVKVSRTLSLSFTVMGQLVQRKGLYVSWYAKGVGQVQYDTTPTSGDVPDHLHLTLKCASSLGPCPAP